MDRTPESEAFAKWLLDVGSGKNVDNDGKISLPENMKCGADVDSLIQSTYPGVHIPNQQINIIWTEQFSLEQMMM